MYVVIFIVGIGGKDHTYRSGREVMEGYPYSGHDHKSDVRTVKQESMLPEAIVNRYRETPAYCYYELIEPVMCVGSSSGSFRNIIDPIDPVDVERDILTLLNHRELAPVVEKT